MAQLFISYRRSDSAPLVGRLRDRLVASYGHDAIFMDTTSIPKARHFNELIQEQIQMCRLVLVVIGPRWAGDLGDRRRIDDASDPVRREVETALVGGIRVLPVYWGGATPSTLSPPPPLGALTEINALMIDIEGDFEHHMRELLTAIDGVVYASRWTWLRHRARRALQRRMFTLALLVAVLLVLFGLRAPAGTWLLGAAGVHTAVATNDNAAFSRSRDGRYEVARLLPDRETLLAETDLAQTLRETRQQFDYFALSGGSLFNIQEVLPDLAARGVRVRVIAVDLSEANPLAVDAYYRGGAAIVTSISDGVAASRNVLKQYQRLLKRYADQPWGQTFFEMRWWQGVFLNSFWVRDPRDPQHCLAHLEVHGYRDETANPSARFGALAPAMCRWAAQEFEALWARSSPVPPSYP